MPRKPPAKRAFSGMVGLPPESEIVAEPAQAPAAVAVMDPEPAPALIELAPKKRGRPPKHGAAMTLAERKAASRANQQAKQDEAERTKLIAELMKIYDRQQVDSLSSVAFAVDRKQRAQYHRDLTGLSVAELRVAMEGKQTPDTHGRLHNERSGEKEQIGGQSEIEIIIGAKQHDSGYFEDEDQNPNMAAGFRVNPVGAAPESFEAEDSEDAVSPGSAKPEFNLTTEEKWRDKAIESLVHKMFLNSSDAAKCLFCEEAFSSEISAENHLAEQYVKGEKDLIRFFDYSWALQQMRMGGSMPPGGGFGDSKPRGLPYLHHVEIQEKMALMKKQSRKKRP